MIELRFWYQPVSDVQSLVSENWNKYTLAFANELILRGRFKEVTIHRLPVGKFDLVIVCSRA